MKLTKLASVAAICFSAAASADVTWTYLGTGLSQNAGLNYGASRAFDARAVSSFSNINVGQHLFEVWGTTRTTFCVQLFEGVTVGGGYNFAQVDVSAVPDAPPAPGPMGVIKASLMQDLYRRYYAGVDSSLEASAFQLAIYEISHENLTASTAVPRTDGRNQGLAHAGSLSSLLLRRGHQPGGKRFPVGDLRDQPREPDRIDG